MARQRFPRQSAPSSGGAATSSASDATLVSATSSGVTSALATTTDLTSGLSSPPTSTAPSSSALSSETTGLTTTSSSSRTTSTPQSTPSSTSSSDSVSSTSSLTPTSSSSIPSSTTTSSALSSASVFSSTITQSPTPSSSQQGTPTTITSSYTTYVNGSAIFTQTSFPSTIPAPPNSSSGNRAAIIGGSAAGGTALLILILSVAFYARRKRFKKLDFLNAIRLRRKQIRSRANLLDEDLANVDLQQPPRRYTDYETPWDARDSRDGSDRALIGGSGAQGTSHASTRPLQSETGSAFRDDLWAQPHEGTRLMDPLANRDDPDLDLSRIMDDVMGPSSAAVHFSDRSVSSMYRDSMAGSEGVVHSRTVSNASNAMLLEAAGLGGTSRMASPSTAPVRSSPSRLPKTRGGNAF